MAEAAPQLQIQNQDINYETVPMPLTLSVAEMPEDAFAAKRAEHFIENAGRIAVQEFVELDTSHEDDVRQGSYANLMEAIHAAKDGDHKARLMIETNVRTDVVERTIKTGHITSVDLELDEQGRIMQFGQTMQNIYANTLAATPSDCKMQPRNKAEALNGIRLEQLNRQGMLDDYNFVVFSMAADDMSEAEIKKAGFFTDTMSVSVQVTTARDDGLVTETAFVSGKDNKTGQRHDKTTVKEVGRRLGVDFTDKTATEIIATPVLVHKSLMPNGVIDVVELYDECVGDAFFGEHRPKQDYKSYKQQCEFREKGFRAKVDSITNELIDEAHNIWSPKQATKKLHKISEKHMVEHAINDETIDALVFGEEAALHIEEARIAQKEGRNTDVARHLQVAEKTAKSSSCPSSASSDEEESAPNKLKKKERMTCPFCKDPNQYGDPCSPNQHCTNCKATVKGGKVVSTGNTGYFTGPTIGEIIEAIIKDYRSKKVSSNNK